jgi:putative tryptophan/tyrosine transport system substrate-binding protein
MVCVLARRASITGLAGRLHLPMIYPFRDYADSGGLMSYAPDLGELAERLAVDVHQILRGPSRAKSQATGPTDSSWLSI